MAARGIRPPLIVGALCVALVVAFALPAFATVSILAVDPATGDVGVAAASCVQFDLARIATVLPGVGVAVSQGHRQGKDPLRLLAAMQKGPTSSDALQLVSAAPRASGEPARQYGVVMLGGGTASLTDDGADQVAADASGANVVVMGSDLRNRRAVDRARDAFLGASGDLAQRLMAGLRASSAAGGDRRCHTQTASASFIIVASRGERPVVPVRGLPGVIHRRIRVFRMVGQTVAADQLGDLLRDAAGLRRPAGPGRPDLYLSLIQPAHGFNAVTLLGQAYRQVLASPTPTPTPTPTPSTSATPSPAVAISRDGGRSGGLAIYAWFALAGILVVVGLRRRSRRRRARAARAGARAKT